MNVDVASLQELEPLEAPTLAGPPAGCCTVPFVDCPASFVTCFGCTASHN